MIAPHFDVTNHLPQPSVCVDLDGCLLVDGKVDKPLAGLCDRLRQAGWFVAVWSARPASHTPTVQEMVADQPWVSAVICGSKPAADLYIDDRGLLPPLDALEEHAALIHAAQHGEAPTARWATPGDDTAFHREMAGVPEAPGRDYEDDPTFRVYAPTSGGLDSSTVNRMARQAGLPLRTFYVDTGAVYRDAEFHALERLGINLDDVLTPERGSRTEYAHIDLGRNATIIWTLAHQMRERGEWGEIWFGNNAGWSESSVRGGDKSHRFFLTINQLLTLNAFDCRVVSPLAGLTKADMVHLWRGDPEVLHTFSCFDPDSGHRRCGQCGSCFRWWTAMVYEGMPWDHADLWWRSPTWDLAKLGRLARPDDTPDLVPYAEGRYEAEQYAINNYPHRFVGLHQPLPAREPL